MRDANGKLPPGKYAASIEGVENCDGKVMKLSYRIHGDAPLEPKTLTQRTHAAEARAAEAEAKHAGILDRFEKAERANNDYVQRICHERDHAMQAKDAEIGYLRTTLSRLTLGGVFVTGTMKT